MPFEDARDFIRTQCIESRKQYQEWHQANKPKQIPKYPNRAYETEWKGWNDYLGTNNKFDDKKKKYRPLAEALVYVHKLGLKTEKEWLKHVQENRDEVPQDIPGRPDIIYNDWRSWMHWLGSKPMEKVEANRQVIRESAIFYIIQEREYADQRSVFTFGMERGGVSGLKDQWEMSKNFRVIQMYEYDEQQMERTWITIKVQSTPYYGSDNIRIVQNINQLVWDIGEHLITVRNA